MEKLYIVSKNKMAADCGSDHELLITKFRIKLKKVGETIRPLRYDLNQIPYDYTVEVAGVQPWLIQDIQRADGIGDLFI